MSRTTIPNRHLETLAYDITSVTVVPVSAGSAVNGEHACIPFELSDVPVWSRSTHTASVFDYAEAFLLLNIDGVSTFETVINLSYVEQEQAIAALVRMLSAGIITVKSRSTEAAPSSSARWADLMESGVWSREAEDEVSSDYLALRVDPPSWANDSETVESSSDPEQLFERSGT